MGKTIILAIILMASAGCQTAAEVKRNHQEREEVQEAFSAVAGAVSGKSLTQEELEKIEKQIRTDDEVKSAVQAITNSMGSGALQVKYCPVTGKRYSANLETCPEHDVELKLVTP